jgi:signal transduction histidine kinase
VASDARVKASGGAPPPVREVQIAGEIAKAFLRAERPYEVYRLALERVAPLVGASFGCVFLREGETDLLRVVAAHNWPQRYASYLGSMRVRVGNGPTGRAVAENRQIDVPDVFSDPELEDWWDSARELGFASSVSLPLAFERKPVGALTLYFRQPEAIETVDPEMLRLVADQLTATAEKAHLIEDLQRANERLREQNLVLEAKYREAEEAKQVKNEFLANVSHELRTPLSAILGYTFLLREGVTGEVSPQQGETLARIEDAGNHLAALIDGLLDLTNLKLGRIASAPELCDAVEVARGALEAAPAPREGVQMILDAPDERIPLHTDPELVLRVLESLLSNAVKFTSNGSIVLRVRTEEPAADGEPYPQGPDVVWEVVDSGIGIAPEDQELIFEEFRQLDGSSSRRFAGAGLGLAIARGLAERLRGEIGVRSAPGEGASFTFTLPSSVVHAGRR